MKIIQYTPGMEIDCPMLVLDMPASVYHSFPYGISKSGLDKVALSPAHWRYSAKREQTRAMVVGSALHCAMLQPDIYEVEYLRLADVAARTASEYKAAVKEWPGGADFVLTGPESDHIAGMQACLWSDSNARALLQGDGHREASLFVRDPVTGVIVRVRFDFLPDDPSRPIVDLKKSRDCRPEKFMRSMADYRYHVQAALYLDALEWATGQRRQFALIAIEDELPHALKPYVVGQESLNLGRKLYREALDTFAACERENSWPCYDTTPEILELPDWVLGEQEIITIDGDDAE